MQKVLNLGTVYYLTVSVSSWELAKNISLKLEGWFLKFLSITNVKLWIPGNPQMSPPMNESQQTRFQTNNYAESKDFLQLSSFYFNRKSKSIH